MKLSPSADAAWQVAAHEASGLKNPEIEAEHVLLGICSLEKCTDTKDTRTISADLLSESAEIERVLQGCQTTAQQFRRTLRARITPGETQHTSVIHRSADCRAYFAQAQIMAEQQHKSKRLTAIHLFIAILKRPRPAITAALEQANIDAQKLRDGLAEAASRGATSTPLLDHFGRDLTRLAAEGKLPPLIGRRDELLHIFQILIQPEKRNPVLIGEAGVGKTAIIEGLAQRIAAGKNLAEKRVIELSLRSLVAGTKCRGEFEERVTQLLAEVRANPDVILFLDELHTVVGAGGSSDGMDAANMLKPALARGEIACIGATTTAEYRRVIEKDAALERRFQPVLVKEPGPDEALEILTGYKDKLERHYAKQNYVLQISEGAVKAAVELSIRYLPDRQLPDKALDVLRQACSQVAVPILSMPLGGGMVDDGMVTPKDIAKALTKMTGREIVLGDDTRDKLLNIEGAVRQQVAGQDHAIERLAAVVRRSFAGLRDSRKPSAVFLFLGPTGVGKTLMAKALAAHLFGSDDDMIRLDMSEYKEKHSVSKLTGAPPGYVDSDREGQLTSKLRSKPWSVVLLDEVEKAHPEVLDLFLQLFGEGRLTDAKGRTIDASHAIFIMTSNLPPDKRMGFRVQASAADVETTLAEVRAAFRPEFVNRIDEIILFRHLPKEQILEITRRTTKALADQLLRAHGVAIEFDPQALEWLAIKGYDDRFGARELDRCIARFVAEPLSQEILAGHLQNRSQILVKPATGGQELEFVSGGWTQ